MPTVELTKEELHLTILALAWASGSDIFSDKARLNMVELNRKMGGVFDGSC